MPLDTISHQEALKVANVLTTFITKPKKKPLLGTTEKILIATEY